MTQGIRIVCPACRGAFRVESAVEPDQPLLCPKCGAKTLAPGTRDPTVPLAQSTLAVPAPEAPTRGGLQADASQRTGELPHLRYTEQQVIGQGGMGEVVLCIDRDIRRPIALKRMLPSAAEDPNHRARFVEEAQVTGQLEHPNIVPIHELGRAPDGTAYFTMKLVKGKSLADILGELRAACRVPCEAVGAALRGCPPQPGGHTGPPLQDAGRGTRDAPPPSLGDLLQIFLKVCDGVAFAHSRGVIHRDLKPANIMVGDYGEVLVMLRRRHDMSKRGKDKESVGGGVFGLGGLLGGLGTMLEKLGELAERGKELNKSGELRSPDGKVRGVYGFNIRMGLGDEKDAVSVEPFGNVRKDERTGKAVVQEVREPMVDTFEEEGHVLVVAEMPGIAEEDARIELHDDILTIAAEKGGTKYRKEVLLPQAFPPGKMSHSCRNGVLEVRFQR